MEVLSAFIPRAEYLADEQAAREFLDHVMRHQYTAVDTETQGRGVMHVRPLFFSLAAGRRRACAPASLLPIFEEFFTSDKIKIFHNAKYDLHAIHNSPEVRFVARGPFIDTAVMSLRENSARPNHTLKYLISDGLFNRSDQRYSRYPTFSELFGKGGRGKKRQDSASEILKEDNRQLVSAYASMDAWSTLVVFEELVKRLSATPSNIEGFSLWDLYWAMEMPLTPILWEYERTGFPVNTQKLQHARDLIERELDRLTREIARLAGASINPSSPQQLIDLFVGHYKLPVVSYTAGGTSGVRKPSVDERTLVIWRDNFPDHAQLVQSILDYRNLVKTRSTYIDGILSSCDDFGRVHTTFNQEVARTGRLSSKNPNLQNIPAHPDPWGIRAAFEAPTGYTVVDCDYEQIEICLAALLADADKMITAILDGKDVHSMTVEYADGIPYETVDAARKAKKRTAQQQKIVDLRDQRKKVGFGILYGQTPLGLSRQLGCTPDAAADLINGWLDAWPGIREYIEDTHRRIQQYGWSSTLLGWRRYFPAGKLQESDSPERHERDWKFQEAMRAGMNHTIQGSAADIMKLALIACHHDKILDDLGMVPSLTVHDEIIGIAPEKNGQAAVDRCCELMMNPLERFFGIKTRVPVTASGKTGKTWAQAKG